ncbi:hypothetical protein BH20ACT4_BH20ACT4_02430 [soil metagenome]
MLRFGYERTRPRRFVAPEAREGEVTPTIRLCFAMTPRRTSRRDGFWNDEPNWDDAKDTHRTRSSRIIPGFSATDPTTTSQSRMFDYKSDDPDYSTGSVRPTSAGTPAGGYAWEVASSDDFDVEDD